MQHLQISNLEFAFPGQASAIFSELSFSAAQGWSGLVGANGTGKSTLLRLIAHELKPLVGSIRSPEPVLLCEQRTDSPPDSLVDLCSYPDAEAGRLVSILEIEGDWPYRWTTLSQGERKRAQVAEALWQQPPVLLLDEPTNHLDGRSRRILQQALSDYRGIGLLVSHDRDLLDNLCYQCLFLDAFEPPRLRPGGYSRGMEVAEQQRIDSERMYQERNRAKQRIEQEAEQRKQVASRQDARNTKRHLDRKDSDGRGKIDMARVTGADGKAGRLYSQLAGRVAHAQRQLDEVRRPVKRRTGITIAGAVAQGDALVARPGGEFRLANGSTVRHPELVIRPTDRVGIVGPNGSGKSTLVEALISTIRRPDRVVYVRQELTRGETSRLVRELKELNHEEIGAAMSTLARLGSEPTALLQSRMPSPGEARKLALAVGFLRSPSLIVMDEPTNHLDLISITGLEEAMQTFGGALLLVSHDERFLRSLVRVRWEFCVANTGSEIRVHR